MLTKHWQRLILLAFGHGLNDFAAGYMLGTMLYLKAGTVDLVAGFLIYNLLAFGGQYFAAALVGKIGNTKNILTATAVVNMIAILLFFYFPHLSLALAGIASAFYHVAGGAACIKENKAASIGVFAAPGIIGLAGAGYLSYLGTNLWTMLVFVCAAFALVLQLVKFPTEIHQTPTAKIEQHQTIDRHDLLMILLLGIIALRSAVWNIFQIVHDHNYTWLLAIAVSAFAGKLAGGWLSDKIGWKVYSLFSLITAMPLVSFFKEELVLFCIGIGLLQSAIPANTALMIRYCGDKQKGIATSLGSAVIIGLFITAPVQFLSAHGLVLWMLAVLVVGSILLFRRSGFSFGRA